MAGVRLRTPAAFPPLKELSTSQGEEFRQAPAIRVAVRRVMGSLPAGTVTFLLTDIEGSTRLLLDMGERYFGVLETHRQLLRGAIAGAGGHEFETQGDGLFVAFSDARSALGAAIAAQRALQRHPWPEGAAVRVRMALHTGEPIVTRSGYVGLELHVTARICKAGHGGQILLSRVVHNLVANDLPPDVTMKDLGQHRLRDLAKSQQLFQVLADDLPADFPPLRTLDIRPHNLPVQLTSFVGRQREKNDAIARLSGSRLLTLTGPGGVGKTRLALEVAAEVLDAYPDGVWWVDLATLTDPALVPHHVAAALKISEHGVRPILDTLSAELQDKRLLLLLDNCEHLVTPCASLAVTLLQTCPYLRLLATSRYALGASGETQWRLPPMALPQRRLTVGVGPSAMLVINGYDAITLFVHRARLVRQEFALNPSTVADVIEICQRLDGLPLAIELAASRLNVLSPRDLLERLDDRFRLLADARRSRRHRALNNVLDWSYEHLNADERTLLDRLTVFVGSFSLEAAERIGGPDDFRFADVVDLLDGLVTKSMVSVEELHDGSLRYRLLETMRQYGQRRLAGDGDLARRQALHAEYFMALAESAAPGLSGPDRRRWLDRVELEYDNLRAALAWSERSAPDVGLRIGGALGIFWQIRGYPSEGRRWLEALLHESPQPTAVRAKALGVAGTLARVQDDYSVAEARYREGRSIYKDLGDQRGVAEMLDGLGYLGWKRADYPAAQSFLERSLALFEELDHRPGIAHALDGLGIVASERGLFERAQDYYQRSLAAYRELGDQRGVAMLLNNIGAMDYRQGEYEAARTCLEESVAIQREIGNHRGVAIALINLGHTARAAGNAEESRDAYRSAMAMLRDLGDRAGLAEIAEGLAYLVASEGGHAVAATLLGAAEALRAVIGVPLPPADHREYERAVQTLRTALRDDALRLAWDKGHTMPIEQSLDLALGGQELHS